MTAPIQTDPWLKPQPSSQTFEPGSDPWIRQPSMEVNGITLTSNDLSNHVTEAAGPSVLRALVESMSNPLHPGNVANLITVGETLTHMAGEVGRDLLAYGKFVAKPSPSMLVAPLAGPRLAKLVAREAGGDPTVTEEEKSALRGGALVGAVALDVGTGGISIAARPVLAQFLRGASAGGLYGLIAPKEDRSIVEAIAQDALLFGGFNVGLYGVSRLIGARASPAAVNPMARQMTDDQIALLNRSFSEELRAEAIAQHRQIPAARPVSKPAEIPEVVGGTMEQLRLLERQRRHAAIIEERALRQVQADGTQARVVLSAMEHRETPMLYNAVRGEFKGSGRSIQEAMDNLAAQSGANAGAGTSVLERMLASERGAIESGLRGPLIPSELAGRLKIAEHPRDLFMYGRYIAPPHTWARIHPVAGSIQSDAVARRLVQDGVHSEWADLIGRTRKGLNKKDRVELGQLLDSYVRGEELPAGTPQHLTTWFGEWRARLNTDREALQKLLGTTPDWGIDSYFMHVFVGDWEIVNAATGAHIPKGFARNLTEATDIAKNALANNPSLDILVRPRQFTWQSDAATELGNRAYQAFLSRAGKALELDRADVQALLSGVTRPKGRQRFFGATQQRKVDLPGFLDDPTEAAAIYSNGLARKLAFHDFETTSLRAIEDAGLKAQGLGNLHDALTDYVARVMGRPGPMEQGWNAAVNWAFAETPLRRLPGVGAQTFRARGVSGTVRKLESMWRLGYSPLSAFVNLTQTLVNTSSKLGYRDTTTAALELLRAARFGGNKAAARRIDGLMVEMGIEYAVPLSAAGDAFGSVHKVAPWSPLYMFNKVENINRSVAGLAGYNRAVAQGLDHSAAVKAGKAASDLNNFIYSVEDLPALLSGPAGQALGQFKPFLVNELHFIAGLRGAEIPRFVANLTAAGGVGAVMSLPGLNIADALGGELFGERPSEIVKRKFPRASRGILGMLGFDAEQSVAINSVMAGRSFAGEGTALQELVDLSLGPGAKDAVAALSLGLGGIQEAASRVIPGSRQGEPMTLEERSRLVRQLMPVEARRLLDAYRIADEGVVRQPTTGRPIFTPANPTKEALLAATGFRSLERAEAQREIDVTRRIAEHRMNDRRAVVQRILEAKDKGDNVEAARLRIDARRRGLVITSDMIARARKERERTVGEQAERRLPRRERRAIQQRVRSTLPSLRPEN